MSLAASALETTLGAIVVAGLGSLATWAGGRLLGKAAFKKATDEGWASLASTLQKERSELSALLHDLREELKTERLKSAQERSNLRGQIDNLTMVVSSLEDTLRGHGLPIPERRHAPITMATIDATSQI